MIRSQGFPDHPPTIYLEGKSRLKKRLGKALETAGYVMTLEGNPCDIALFFDDGKDLRPFEQWTEKWREEDAETLCWACMDGLTKRQIRGLQKRFHIFVPGTTNLDGFRERILGELYIHQRAQVQQQILVGRSKAMEALRAMMDRFAPSNEPVLLLGESGSGKELCAEYLHDARKKGPWKTVNCASLQPGMVESELFGHAKGAFTSAVKARRGIFLNTGDGSCFLDEIGELALDAQGALLRVIEDRKVRPIGSDHAFSLDCRLVLATHRNLVEAVKAKGFREDLYRRIEHLQIKVPPLRERREDIPLLVAHFIDKFNEKHETDIRLPLSFDIFFQYAWPGNVRELRGAVQRALMGQKQGPLDTRDIAADFFQSALESLPTSARHIPFYPGTDSWEMLYDRCRKAYLEDALQRAGGVNARLEDILGIKKSKIYRDLKQYEISTKNFRKK